MKRFIPILIAICLCFHVLAIQAASCENGLHDDMTLAPLPNARLDLDANRYHIGSRILLFGFGLLYGEDDMSSQMQQSSMYEIWQDAHAMGVYADIADKVALTTLLEAQLASGSVFIPSEIGIEMMKASLDDLVVFVHGYMVQIDEIKAQRRASLALKRAEFIRCKFPRLLHALRNLAKPGSRKNLQVEPFLLQLQIEAAELCMSNALQNEDFLTIEFSKILMPFSDAAETQVARFYAAFYIELMKVPDMAVVAKSMKGASATE